MSVEPNLSFWIFFFVGFVVLFIIGWCLIKCKAERTHDPADRPSLSCKGDPPGRSVLYTAAVQLIIHAENITWARGYNFLTANSILLLAWAAIFSRSSADLKSYILGWLAGIGIFINVIWAPFGSRSRRYLNEYVNIGTALEQNSGPPIQQPQDGPLNAGNKVKFLFLEMYCKSEYLSVVVPLAFAAIFWFFFLASVFSLT